MTAIRTALFRGVRTLMASLGVLLCIALAFETRPAHAQFADCAAAGFLGAVDDRMSGVAMACDEAVRFTIETPRGSRQVRIIYSRRDTYPDLLGMTLDIRRGIERAAEALMAIGEGAPGDITIWASNLSIEEDSEGFIDEGAALPVDDADGECVFAIYEQTGARQASFLAAHEFFHCVQFATFGHKTLRSASSWWVEGAAEWFANRAFPGTGQSDGFVAEFDAASHETALTAMEYSAVVFFFWLDEVFGASMAMELMEVMPDSGGTASQQHALANFLRAEDFQLFAEAYVDQDIAQPGGRSIRSNPFLGDTYVWSETRTIELAGERFVLVRFKAEFACGTWSIERTEERGTWHIRDEDTTWRDMPPRLTIAGPEPKTFRAAAFGIQPDGFHATVAATPNPCERCRERTVDEEALACLIGRWELVSGGYGEQIQRALEMTGQFESIQYPDMHSVLAITPDGRFEYPGPPEEYNAQVRNEGGDLFQGIGTLSMASNGQWSIDGDTLYMCEQPHHATIDLTLIDPEGNLDRGIDSGGPNSGTVRHARRFACEGDALTLVEPGAMTWGYARGE